MDVGGYKTVDDSSRLDRVVKTRSNACRLDSMKVDWNYKLDQGAKEQAPRSEHEQTQAWYTNTMYYSFYKRVQTNDTI